MKRQQRAEARPYHHGRLKDALIEAARSLIAERGAAGFTLSEAAKRVGVTAAASYRHFADRAALIDELARKGFDLFGQKLERAWDEGRPDSIAAFRRMGEAYLAFATSEPGLYAAMFGNVATLESPPLAASADCALTLMHNACRTVLIEYGADAGGARELTLEIWSFSHGVAMLAASGHLSDRRDADPRRILESGARNLVEMAIRRAMR